MGSQVNGKRVAKNTLLLYFRMILIMCVSLYTSRVVLATLGIQDFGIYNVVGGLVAMFGVVTGALSAAVSRFLNIEMGKNDDVCLRKVFSAAVFIHILLSIIIVILAELVGPWFIANKMTIPADRLYAAHWVFHCSIISFAINLISVPYNGCIIAHENMKIYAYVSILEAILKLAIVFILTMFTYDKLILYGILMMGIAISIRVIYQFYCAKHYPESHFCKDIDYTLVKNMFGFASWNMLGSTSVIFADQGVNVLINVFCSPIANAARGIAMQVNNAINQFSTSFMTALNPQITKCYGANEMDTYKSLMINGSKLSVCLLMVISLPFMLERNYILSVWLKEVPEYTSTFVVLILLFTINEAFSHTFTTGLLATGKIKNLMLMVAGARLMNFPISMFVLYVYHRPEATIVVSIIISNICLLLRLYLLKKYIKISIFEYYSTVVIRTFAIFTLCNYVIKFFVTNMFEPSAFRFILSSLSAECLLIPAIYFFGCNSDQRQIIRSMLIKVIIKVKKQ